MNDSERTNPLEAYFHANPGHRINKWRHYFDIYHRHFERYRNEAIAMVEFGVAHGGSLQMWKDYFDPRSRIYGVDLDPGCKGVEEERIAIRIGDQEDRAFLRQLRDEIGEIDIVIDDGDHTMGQQITTFEEMFPALVSGGTYLVEDVHTSYWASHGGGYEKPGTFVEYAKHLIDQLHAWHSRDEPRLKVDRYTRHIRGIHIYDSVVVFEKGRVRRPRRKRTGQPAFERSPRRVEEGA